MNPHDFVNHLHDVYHHKQKSNFLHCSELPQHLQYADICGSQMTYLMSLLIQSFPLVL